LLKVLHLLYHNLVTTLSNHKYVNSYGNWVPVYEQYPLLNRLYMSFLNTKLTKNFIAALGLNNYSNSFLEATKRRPYKQYQDQNDQATFSNDMADVFGLKINKESLISTNVGDDIKQIQLSESGLDEIKKAFPIYVSNDNDTAKLLLVLSAMFTMYSSSSFFGTEEESPQPLRNYALALLNHAVLLDSTLVDNTEHNDWCNRFLGINNAFSCTAIIARDMKTFIKNKNNKRLNEIFNSIFPTNW
ncbi:MAG: hypothetical protein ACO3K7_06210, partial [Candidatus Marinamargulisbacteria bacterium]